MKRAKILEEGKVEKSLLIEFYRNLSDLHNEVKKEERDFTDVRSKEEEDISYLFGSNFDEVKVFEGIFLVTDEVLSISVVIFTKKLKELESSFVGTDASKTMDLLISSFRFKNIFTPDIFLISFVEIVVINGSD